MPRIVFSMIFVTLVAGLSAQTPSPLFISSASSRVITSDSPGQVVLRDINGDGRLDLVTRHLLQKLIGVHLGDGAGHFTPVPGSPIGLQTQPGDVDLADFNGDKLPDLVVSHSEDDRIDLYFGDGKGAFKPAPGSPFTVSKSTEFYTRSIDLIDVNEDGKLDVATANHRQNTLATMLGDGRGGFTTGPTITIPMKGSFAFASGDLFGDLDGDKHVDLAVVLIERNGDAPSRPASIAILYGDGKGGFQERPSSPLEVAPGAHFVRLADVDGDRRLDIVTSHRDNQISALLNRGNGKFSAAPGSPYDLVDEAFALMVADINRDQRNDFVAATVESVTVMLGGSDKPAQAPGSPFKAGPGAYDLTLGDLNNDGKVDIVASSFGGNAVTILLGR